MKWCMIPVVFLLFSNIQAVSVENPFRFTNWPNWPEKTWSLDKFHNFVQLPKETNEDPTRFLMGDANGFVHVYEERNQAFQEIWLSEFLEGTISGLFVTDINADNSVEIVVYTLQGRIHIFNVNDYRNVWSNPPNEYNSITAMVLHNVDEDEQLEMIFCGDGMLIIYDGLNFFEQWRSEQSNMAATEIVIGDVDGDRTNEIILNDGFIYDAQFQDLEWQSPESFGDQLGLLDLDDDGIVEVIGQFHGRAIRVYDIDLRRQKSARQ